jgi:hypothetical protein
MATNDHVACLEAVQSAIDRRGRVIEVCDLMRDLRVWKTTAVFDAIDRLVVEGTLQAIGGPPRRPTHIRKGGNRG